VGAYIACAVHRSQFIEEWPDPGSLPFLPFQAGEGALHHRRTRTKLGSRSATSSGTQQDDNESQLR